MSYPELELRMRFPEIDWDEPVKVTVMGFGPGKWVCRYCIALHGFRGEQILDSEFVFPDPDEVRAHVRAHHQQELG